MFGIFSKPKRNVRARDGWQRQTSSERRAHRKAAGFTPRQQKKAIKARRRYKKHGLY